MRRHGYTLTEVLVTITIIGIMASMDLPSLDPEGTFGLLAESLGLTYAQLIGRVLEAAIVRNNQSSNPKLQINTTHQ